MPPTAIGSYIFPLRFFGNPHPDHADAATEIVKDIQIGEHLVHVTRGGGLFVTRPEGLATDELFAFNEAIEISLNRLICEFALAANLISEPMSPVHFWVAQLSNGHIDIRGAAGGRESYYERSIGPSTLLNGSDWWTSWTPVDESAVDQVAPLNFTTTISSISESAPRFVASAYSHYSRAHMAEAIIDAFVVIEQIVDHYWSQHISQVPLKRRERLKDTRLYTASSRIEVLETTGVIDSAQSTHFHNARGHRNNVAHRGAVGPDSAKESMSALKAALELLCGDEVTQPQTSKSVMGV